MSPKSRFASSEDVTVAARKLPDIEEEKKEIKWGYDFERIDKPFGMEQHIFNILWLGPAHLFALYSFYLVFFTDQVPNFVLPFELIYGYIGGLGTTVGCHRYWTHKTFKANTPMRVILMIQQTIANQYPIFKWSQDHRIHHKYIDTNADPHNSTRGFWFSHMGWLFLPKHKDLQEKLKTFDMSDLQKDPIVRFQSSLENNMNIVCKRWYWSLTAVICFVVPISLMVLIYDLPVFVCFVMNYRRYVLSLHFTWMVNSVAHIFGDKPFDKSITASDNRFVSIVAVGEGWHNYHHTFPWDYKASEFGWKINASTLYIDFFASIGWIWDMKTVSQKMLKDRLRRTGDGTHTSLQADSLDVDDFDHTMPADVTELMKEINQPLWGWDDENLPNDFRKVTKIIRPEGIK